MTLRGPRVTDRDVQLFGLDFFENRSCDYGSILGICSAREHSISDSQKFVTLEARNVRFHVGIASVLVQRNEVGEYSLEWPHSLRHSLRGTLLHNQAHQFLLEVLH